MINSNTVACASVPVEVPTPRFFRSIRVLMAAVLLASTLPVSTTDARTNTSSRGQGTVVAAEIALPQSLQEEEFVRNTNSARADVGLAPLTVNGMLTKAAQAKAEDMLRNRYWNHYRPSDHKAPWDFIKEAGYTYHVAGENLSRGFVTAEATTKAWLASPTHKANLLSEKYTEEGFATVRGLGQEGEPVYITVQMFGSR